MGLIDILCIAVIGIGAFRGYTKGFINQLAAIAGLIIGFIAAKKLYLAVAEKIFVYLPETSMTVIQVFAFIAIWILVPLLFTLVASLLTYAIKPFLGLFNNILGFLFGTVKWILIAGLVINVLEFVDWDHRLIPQTKKEESMLYYPIKEVISSFFPIAGSVKEEYIDL